MVRVTAAFVLFLCLVLDAHRVEAGGKGSAGTRQRPGPWRAALAEIQRTTFEPVAHLRELPASVAGALAAAVGEKIADAGGDWEATDEIRHADWPRRRLRFAGRSPTLWLVYYDHGGRGLHQHALSFVVMPDGTARLHGTWEAAQGATSIADLAKTPRRCPASEHCR